MAKFVLHLEYDLQDIGDFKKVTSMVLFSVLKSAKQVGLDPRQAAIAILYSTIDAIYNMVNPLSKAVMKPEALRELIIDITCSYFVWAKLKDKVSSGKIKIEKGGGRFVG